MNQLFLAKARELLNKSKQPLAYVIVIFAPAIRMVSDPNNQYVTTASVIALGLLLLPLFFEIHKKITDQHTSRFFNTFDSAMHCIKDEIDRAAAKGHLDIKYLALAGYHWPIIESCLSNITKQPRSPKCTLRIAILDPDWEGVEHCNNLWKEMISGTINAFTIFKTVNENKASKKWTMDIRHYRTTPQFFGILINNSVLFFCCAYWEKNLLRGGNNPTEIIRTNQGECEKIRIHEFAGWFEYFWNQSNNLKIQ